LSDSPHHPPPTAFFEIAMSHNLELSSSAASMSYLPIGRIEAKPELSNLFTIH